MIKLRQKEVRPKLLAKLLLGIVLLGAVFTACKDDVQKNTIDQVLYIDGPASVNPASTHDFVAGDYAGDVVWNVTGNASLSSSDGTTAQVVFEGVGEATISASGNGFTGTRVVNVLEVGIGYSTAFMISPTINEDGVDEITVTFDAPLASIPELVLNGTVAGDTSVIDLNPDGSGNAPYVTGALTTFTEVAGSNMTKFSATYTATGASETSGQLEGYMNNVEVDASYGGATSAREYFLLHSIDNTAPIGSMAVSATAAKDGASIEVTLTMNEASRPNPHDGDMVVDYTYSAGASGTNGQVVLTSGDDPTVWTGTIAVDGTGNGSLSIVMDQSTVVDMAGNSATELDGTATVTIDNTAPNPTLTAGEDPVGSKLMKVNPSSEEVIWIFLPDNSQFVPEGPADFDGEGKGTSKFVVAAGAYKIYYMEVDAAGNESTIKLLDGITVAD